ncbi:MAG: sigma-70 family RNA polymerase sigma factor [Gammaproteobacteria bacterium]|nr:sigma-70 family RNA polymerase sigma factor [Gammaproteobacteria bacterium]
MTEGVSDEALMLRYGGGDAGAFDVLFKRHKAPLHRYFSRQCGNQAVAEELFQDLWMNVIRNRQRYDARAKFTTYLYTLAHNRLIDHYRSMSSKTAQMFNDDASVDPEMVPDEETQPTDIKADMRQRVSRLLELIEKLPVPQREAFLMQQESGMSLEEIAETTGVNRETVKSRLRYALVALRRGMRGWI